MLSRPARLILAVHALVLGLGYALGPRQWSSGGSFAVVRQLGLPIPVWGAVFMVIGLLLLVRRHSAGHALAVFALGFWGCCLAATLLTGQLTGWGAPVHTLVLALPFHVLGLWRRGASRARARAQSSEE